MFSIADGRFSAIPNIPAAPPRLTDSPNPDNDVSGAANSPSALGIADPADCLDPVTSLHARKPWL